LGGGTTEYALDALCCAATGVEYICPIPYDTILPMIHSVDLIEALCCLMQAPPSHFPSGMSPLGCVIAGFSFSPQELFLEIQKHIPTFTFRYDAAASPSACRFAELWPNSLSKEETFQRISFKSKYDLTNTVADVLRSHQLRIAEDN
jgi:hypothetical protein